MGEVVGVLYFDIAGAPGRYFDCPDYRATLSVDRCSKNHVDAQAVEIGGRLDRCRDCKTGAAHASREVPTRAKKLIFRCCRCHTKAQRLIRGAICVSCYNREREVDIGANAKGTVPNPVEQFWGGLNSSARRCKTAQLHSISVSYLAGGQIPVLAEGRVADTLELVLAVVRRDPDALFFRARPSAPFVVGHE